MSKTTANAGPKPRVLRKLGSMERYQTALFALDYYCGTIISCRYSVPGALCDRDSYDKLVEHVEVAVADTVLQHPLLQVGLIKEATRKPYYVTIDRVDLAQQIEWRVVEEAEKYEQVCRDVLLQQIDTKFPDVSARPGWRLAILRLGWSNMLEIMFVWNHSHFDGTSAKIFHQTLLRSLNSGDAPGRPKITNHTIETNVTTKNMPPPQHSLIKYKISPGFAASQIWQEIKPPMYKQALGVPHCTTHRKTGIVSLYIDNGTLQKALSACRANKTTLTGLIHAITFVSLAPQVQEEDLGQIEAETPINLRPFLDKSRQKYSWIEPTKLMQNCVTKLMHSFPRELVEKVRTLAQDAGTPEGLDALEAVVWSVSATVRGEIQAHLDKKLKDDGTSMMPVVPDWRDYAKDTAKKLRKCTWLLTNVGVIDGEPKDVGTEEGWSIKRGEFTLSADVIAPVYSISAVAIKGGELGIDITWQDSVADAEIAKKLIDNMEMWLKHVAFKV